MNKIDATEYQEILNELIKLEDRLTVLHNTNIAQVKFYRFSIPYLKTCNVMADIDICIERLRDCLGEISALNRDIEKGAEK